MFASWPLPATNMRNTSVISSLKKKNIFQNPCILKRALKKQWKLLIAVNNNVELVNTSINLLEFDSWCITYYWQWIKKSYQNKHSKETNDTEIISIKPFTKMCIRYNLNIHYWLFYLNPSSILKFANDKEETNNKLNNINLRRFLACL